MRVNSPSHEEPIAAESITNVLEEAGAYSAILQAFSISLKVGRPENQLGVRNAHRVLSFS